MKICIIGIGNIGAAIANALLLTSDTEVYLYEPHEPSMKKAKAQFYDLLPIAEDRGVSLHFCESLPKADKYVITAGVPRTSSSQRKLALFAVNRIIVHNIAKEIQGETYVVTNPPIEICDYLRGHGIDAKPIRKQVDEIRGGVPNGYVITHKGFTEYTPGYAIAKEIRSDDE